VIVNTFYIFINKLTILYVDTCREKRNELSSTTQLPLPTVRHRGHLPSTLLPHLVPSPPSPPSVPASLLPGLLCTESPLPLGTLAWWPLDPPSPAPNIARSDLLELHVTGSTLSDLGLHRIRHGGDGGVHGPPRRQRRSDAHAAHPHRSLGAQTWHYPPPQHTPAGQEAYE
jgi:hypothetical protein